MQDWDDAPGAIDWPRLRSFLKLVKETGDIPEWHRSHDHLNEQKEIPLDESVREKWKGVFESVVGEGGEVNVVWGIVDGFLLYWDRVSGAFFSFLLCDRWVYALNILLPVTGDRRSTRRSNIPPCIL